MADSATNNVDAAKLMCARPKTLALSLPFFRFIYKFLVLLLFTGVVDTQFSLNWAFYMSGGLMVLSALIMLPIRYLSCPLSVLLFFSSPFFLLLLLLL